MDDVIFLQRRFVSPLAGCGGARNPNPTRDSVSSMMGCSIHNHCSPSNFPTASVRTPRVFPLGVWGWCTTLFARTWTTTFYCYAMRHDSPLLYNCFLPPFLCSCLAHLIPKCLVEKTDAKFGLLSLSLLSLWDFGASNVGCHSAEDFIFYLSVYVSCIKPSCLHLSRNSLPDLTSRSLGIIWKCPERK